MELLKNLCSLHGPSGEEFLVRDFILNHISANSKNWNKTPKVFADDILFQDAIILVFGKPRTAIFAHMDTTGFTVRYENQLIPIGGPLVEEGTVLTGKDSAGPIRCRLQKDADGHIFHDFGRSIERGTSLVFEENFSVKTGMIHTPYLDNRLGVYEALKLAETMENGLIAFSCWEEHGGGSVPVLARFMIERFGVRQAIICDVTYQTDGVEAGKGTVVSLRDRNIPRKKFIDKVLELAVSSGADYQMEVEAGGSSDGRELQTSPYPIDWVFIGPPGIHIHSPLETVSVHDIDHTLKLYNHLISNL